MAQNALFALAAQVLAGLRAQAGEELRLLDQQAQRAALTLALLLGYGVAAALALGFAWLALCAIVLLGLMARDLSPSLALLLVLLLNLACALGCGLALRRQARRLAFPGTRQGVGGTMLWLAWRQLRPQNPPVPAPPP